MLHVQFRRCRCVINSPAESAYIQSAYAYGFILKPVLAFDFSLAFKYGRAIAYNDICDQYSLQRMLLSAIFGLLAMTDFIAQWVMGSQSASIVFEKVMLTIYSAA